MADQCSTHGNFHFYTFDKVTYDFPGLCSYTLARDCLAANAEEEFDVTIINERNPETRRVPRIAEICITIGPIVSMLLFRPYAEMPHFGF